jgi:hypothetical protein
MRIVDPRGRVPEAGELLPPSPRLPSLEGRRLGVLVNEAGRALITDWDGMSLHLQDLLQERQGVAGFERIVKPLMSAPAPAEVIDRLSGMAGVINGLGK